MMPTGGKQPNIRDSTNKESYNNNNHIYVSDFVSGLNLRQCQSSFIDADMDSSNNEVTCEGAKGTETIVWQFTDGGVNAGTITCTPSGQCDNNALFTATRSAGSTSSRLTFKANIKTFRTVYGNMNLICLTRDPSNPGTDTDHTSCHIDVIRKYPCRCSEIIYYPKSQQTHNIVIGSINIYILIHIQLNMKSTVSCKR